MESKYYWKINTVTYTVDGDEIPKGRMRRKEIGERPLINPFWRMATDEEIETKQYHKGYFFNLKNV